MTGVLFQGYAFYALLTRSLICPIIWPPEPLLYAVVRILYELGYFVANAMLIAEFFRKNATRTEVVGYADPPGLRTSHRQYTRGKHPFPERRFGTISE